MAIDPPSITAIKNAFLLAEVKAFAKSQYNDENLEFLFSKENNQVLYTKFISEDGPRQVNLPGRMRVPLDELAKKKQWSAMSAGLKVARVEITKLANGQTMTDFAKTDYGQRVLAAWKMGLDGAKAKQAVSLIALYEKPRTPEDGWQAFQLLVKAAGESKARAALTALGKAPPAKAPITNAQQVAKNVKLDEQMKKLGILMTQALSYYESAIKSVQKDGLPRDGDEVDRMFESGRMRHDKVHLPWTELIRRHPDLTKIYKEAAKQKEKVDTQWAAYRKLLK